MTPVRLEPAAPRSGIKHSTTEPLGSPIRLDKLNILWLDNKLANSVDPVELAYCQASTLTNCNEISNKS